MTRYLFPGCTAILLLYAGQLFAQQPAVRLKSFTPTAQMHSGLQSYTAKPPHWHGLDLALFFRVGNPATGMGAFCTTCNNTVLGSLAFQYGTESNSTAIGYMALFGGRSAIGYNTAVGANALQGWGYVQTDEQVILSFGYYNVALGAYALQDDSAGSNNTATGYDAMYTNIDGNYNVADGYGAMYANTNGVFNLADGGLSLYSNTTGNLNTAVGPIALESNTTGSNNTGVGYNANVASGALTNATAIGANATVSSSNQVVIGSTSVTSIGGYENWTKFSDGRYKRNIQPNVPGLAFINKLLPVTYTLDVAGIESKLHRGQPTRTDSAGARTQDDPIAKQALQEKAGITYTGFIAQDVEKAADSLNFAFSGVDKPKSAEQSFYGLRYGDFVPPLVRAVQELSAGSDRKDSVINTLAGQVDSLQFKYNSLQTQLNELRAIVAAQKSTASLDQNAPNPFTGSTVIGYYLPEGVSSAQMRISDMTGKVLAIIPLSGSGKSTVKADVSGFAAGTYSYSLIINGKLIGTRQMISLQ